MSHKIIFNVASSVPIYPACVKLTSNSTYVDTIFRNKEYYGESQITISFTNLCSVGFSVPAITLFTNTENGGSFSAKVSAFTIGVNQTINIPLQYYGNMKTTDAIKSFIIVLNGSSSSVQLHISDNVIQYPPVITDVIIGLENRASKTFYLADFTNQFSDPNGDTLASITLQGDLSKLRLNGAVMTSPSEVSAYQLSVGALTYLGQNTDEEVNVLVSLKAKDSSGLTSL